jgi:hypothetical protein
MRKPISTKEREKKQERVREQAETQNATWVLACACESSSIKTKAAILLEWSPLLSFDGALPTNPVMQQASLLHHN